MEINLFDRDLYIRRRAALMQNFSSGNLLFLGNKESSVNFKDNWYPFRQDSTFLYYFGLNIPDLSAILDCESGDVIIFGEELSIDDIIWTGPLPTLQELGEKVGVSNIKPSSALSDHINDKTHFLPPYRPEHQIQLSRLSGNRISDLDDLASQQLIESIVKQRNQKSKEEIQTLHEACTFTAKMHFEVMANAKSEMYEYDLVAMAKQFGASKNVNFSFLPICTTNGHILHNHSYSNKLKSGDLVLFDGGLESHLHYAGDMTRTFPVDRKFTANQADLYQIVLNAQKAAIKKSKVGTTFLDVHLTAAKYLVRGLNDLGIMKGDPEEAVMAGAHTMFFQCGLGHLMGLDVHDMENLGEQNVGYTPNMVKSKEFGLKSLRLGRTLEEGFVVTIEPGIYIIPELIDKFKSENKFLDFIDYKELNHYRNFGGIRIEDDYLIKQQGIELLGEPLAKEIKEIEEIRSKAVS